VQKPGINYPDLEPANEFWNRVRVPGSCYKSPQNTFVLLRMLWKKKTVQWCTVYII